MRRRLLNLAVAVSLVLCVTIVCFWIIGARREAGNRGAYYAGKTYFAQVITYKHVISFSLAAGRHWPQIQATHFPALSGFGAVRRGEWGAIRGDLPLPPLPGNMAFTGVSLDGAIWLPKTPAVRVRVITIAANWWLILLALLALAWLLFTLANRRRGSRGVCAQCGYDLCATPQRCPECGTSATPATQAKPQPAEGAAA